MSTRQFAFLPFLLVAALLCAQDRDYEDKQPHHFKGPPEILSDMPPLFSLKDTQLAAIIGYIRNSWGNTGSFPAQKNLRPIRDATSGRASPWTEGELRPLLFEQP
jgi:mono/diheme cytochrome c family protein